MRCKLVCLWQVLAGAKHGGIRSFAKLLELDWSVQGVRVRPWAQLFDGHGEHVLVSQLVHDWHFGTTFTLVLGNVRQAQRQIVLVLHPIDQVFLVVKQM